jgi:hypothetical protein
LNSNSSIIKKQNKIKLSKTHFFFLLFITSSAPIVGGEAIQNMEPVILTPTGLMAGTELRNLPTSFILTIALEEDTVTYYRRDEICMAYSPTRTAGQALVAHACNPSYSGGRHQEDRGSKTALTNSL